MKNLVFVLVFMSQIVFAQQIDLSQELINKISSKICENETGKIKSNSLYWSKNEKFLSLGIAHFIWYPKDYGKKIYTESFADFLKFLKKEKIVIPTWLEEENYCPWSSREEFYSDLEGSKKDDLYFLLNSNYELQTKFLVKRLQKAVNKIVKLSRNEHKIKTNFYSLSRSGNGIYAMLDYVNFKGEGLSENEKYNEFGWGLKQVLENMDSKFRDPAKNFAISAQKVLQKRVKHRPNEELWLAGWFKRLRTYYEQKI